MIAPYRLLCRVQFRHAYFADGVGQGLTERPTPATAARLRRVGLVFRPLPDGFALLAPTAPPVAPAAPWPLLFVLEAPDAAFWLYSDLPRDAGPGAAYFVCPAPDPPAAGGAAPPPAWRPRLLSQCGDGDDFLPAACPWGVLELGAEALGAEPAVYTLAVGARSALWRYHLRLPGPLTGAAIDAGTGPDFAPCPSPPGWAGPCFEARAPIPLAERYGFPPFRLLTAARGQAGPSTVVARLPHAPLAGVRHEGVGAEAVLVADIFVQL